jgi:hypothetical protein
MAFMENYFSENKLNYTMTVLGTSKVDRTEDRLHTREIVKYATLFQASRIRPVQISPDAYSTHVQEYQELHMQFWVY